MSLAGNIGAEAAARDIAEKVHAAKRIVKNHLDDTFTRAEVEALIAPIAEECAGIIGAAKDGWY